METTLGKRIVRNRKKLGLTQDQLAEQLGITAQAVSKWENDQTCPDITMLPKLADIFGISTDALLGHGTDTVYAPTEVLEQEEAESGKKGIDWEFTETSYKQMAPEGKDQQTYLYGEVIWNNQGRADLFGNMVSDTPGNNRTRQSAYLNVVKAYETDYDYLMSFLKFTDDEQYVIDNSLADIKAYYQQKHVEFVTGVADIATQWDSYVAEFEKMNLSGLLEVYQAAYDRFIANM